MVWSRRKAISGLVAMAGMLTAFSFAPVQAQQVTASGKVRRVNPSDGKITIMHGEIVELKLPAMTLVYRVEPQLIQEIQPGDQVTFTVVRQNGDYVIIEIRKG